MDHDRVKGSASQARDLIRAAVGHPAGDGKLQGCKLASMANSIASGPKDAVRDAAEPRSP